MRQNDRSPPLAPATGLDLNALRRESDLRAGMLQVRQIELEIQNEELRHANGRLQHLQCRYHQLFEDSPVGSLILDQTGLIQKVNAAGRSILGEERHRLLTRKFAQFLDDSCRPAFALHLQQVIAQDAAQPQRVQPPATASSSAEPLATSSRPEALRLQAQLVRPDGALVDVQLESVQLADQDEAEPLICTVMTDVTALLGAEREVRRLNRALETQIEWRAAHTRQLNDELTSLVRCVTRDMARPMRQIQGFAGLLQGSGAVHDDTGSIYLGHLMTAVSRMSAQIAALTTFFQCDQPINHHQPLDLNRLVRGIMYELAPDMVGRPVCFTHDPLPTLHADRMSMHAVFSNLLAHAIQSTRDSPEAHIHIGLNEEQDDYLFCVRHNGAGFEPRDSERVFEVFRQLQEGCIGAGPGAELALVRRIVNRYGGRVWVYSSPHEDTVFWVQLPREPRALLEDAPSEAGANLD